MPITVTNLIAGPGNLYRAQVGTPDPTDPAVSLATIPAWVDLGGTSDGAGVTIGQTFESVTADQTVDIIASLPTERATTLETSLMERTMSNLRASLNGGTITTGASVDKFEPINDATNTPPEYCAVAIQGTSQINGKAGLLVLRRCLVTDDVSMEYKKGGVTMLGVTWTSHYVSSVVGPWFFLQQH